MRLPLFPLHVVAFPHLPLPLHIFERKYRPMTADLLKEGNEYGGRFVVTMISAGREVASKPGTGQLTVRRVGTICEVRRADRFADGRYALMTVGVGRARIRRVDHSGPYAVADVTPLDERRGEDAESLIPDVQVALDGYLSTIREFLAERDAAEMEELLADVDVEVDPDLISDTTSAGDVKRVTRMDRLIKPIHLPSDPLAASYAVAGVLQVELSRKQRLLEAPDAAARLRAELALLQREAQLLGNASLAPMGRFEYHAN
jgi:Lon protease-like protein